VFQLSSKFYPGYSSLYVSEMSPKQFGYSAVCNFDQTPDSQNGTIQPLEHETLLSPPPHQKEDLCGFCQSSGHKPTSNLKR
jgi:hypothetical protein